MRNGGMRIGITFVESLQRRKESTFTLAEEENIALTVGIQLEMVVAGERDWGEI